MYNVRKCLRVVRPGLLVDPCHLIYVGLLVDPCSPKLNRHGRTHSIGFGDIVPSSQASRLFSVFFALGGVCIVGVGLGEVRVVSDIKG